MPAPNYRFARYTDWIGEYVRSKISDKKKGAEVNEEIINQLLEMLSKYEEDSKGYEEDIKNHHKEVCIILFIHFLFSFSNLL